MQKNIRILSLSVILIPLLFSCSGAEQKPTKSWTVKVKTQGEPKIWVWKYDDSKQCEGDGKLTPEAVAAELRGNGVVVYQLKNGSDGRMYPSVCGGKTGKTVDLEIARTDLGRAQGMGFRVKN